MPFSARGMTEALIPIHFDAVMRSQFVEIGIATTGPALETGFEVLTCTPSLYLSISRFLLHDIRSNEFLK